MTRRLTPRRLEFLAKAAADPWTRLYPEWEDIPEHGLSRDDVNALVELGLITLDGQPGRRAGGQLVTVTDAGRAEVAKRATPAEAGQ